MCLYALIYLRLLDLLRLPEFLLLPVEAIDRDSDLGFDEGRGEEGREDTDCCAWRGGLAGRLTDSRRGCERAAA